MTDMKTKSQLSYRSSHFSSLSNEQEKKKLLIFRITMSKRTNKPYEMLRLIFLFVASLESTSFSIDIVEILSDLKMASPFLKRHTKTQSMVKC